MKQIRKKKKKTVVSVDLCACGDHEYNARELFEFNRPARVPGYGGGGGGRVLTHQIAVGIIPVNFGFKSFYFPTSSHARVSFLKHTSSYSRDKLRSERKLSTRASGVTPTSVYVYTY